MMDQLETAAELLKWLRDSGRRVWVDAGGLQFDREFDITPELAARLMAAHDDVVLLLRVEALLARIQDDSKGQP